MSARLFSQSQPTKLGTTNLAVVSCGVSCGKAEVGSSPAIGLPQHTNRDFSHPFELVVSSTSFRLNLEAELRIVDAADVVTSGRKSVTIGNFVVPTLNYLHFTPALRTQRFTHQLYHHRLSS